MTTKVFLFDLGGVLADLASPTKVMNLEMTDDDFWAIWLNSSSVYAFETGNMLPAEFCAKIGRELSLLEDSFDENRFQQWKLNLFPGAETLLKSLACRHKVALLSNTNSVHWHQITQRTQVFSQFFKVFLSYEIGMHKPAVGIYRYVVEKMGCTPSDVIFFDDSELNVSAAQRFGIDARRVQGIDELERAVCAELEL